MLKSRPRLRVALLVLLFALVFVNNIGGYDLWPPDEPRFAEVAREMILSGDPITLHVNDAYYKEKPPLLFWLISAVSLPGSNEITSFTARVPSVAAALFALILTYLLARRLFDERTAALSMVVLGTTALFWWEARSVRTDMLLTGFTTAMLYAFWRWHEDPRTKWLLALYGAMAAALLAKGPPALVFPLLLIATFYWKKRDERRQLHWIAGTLVAIVPVLVWFALSARSAPAVASPTDDAGIGANLFRQTIGRFFLGVSKAEPPWYFLEVLPAYLLPWTVFLPWTLVWTWRHRHDGPAMRLLLGWTLPALVFFSISIGKRAVYVLPLYPAFAILFARSILELMDSDRLRWRRYTAVAWGALLFLASVALFAVRFTEYGDQWIGFAGIGMLVLFLAADAFWRATRFGHRLPTAIATHVILLTLAVSTLGLPAVNVHKSAKAFTAPVRALSRQGQEFRLYSLGFSREEYVFYSEHFHTPVLTDLLPLDLPDKPDLKKMATLQRRLKKAIMQAVKEVPVADWASVTDKEVAALRAAIDSAAVEAEVKPEEGDAFERALEKAIGSFATEFETGGPAFFFAQEEDWRWIIALNPHLRDYTIIRRQPVGSRTVLLVANAAAAALAPPPQE